MFTVCDDLVIKYVIRQSGVSGWLARLAEVSVAGWAETHSLTHAPPS